MILMGTTSLEKQLWYKFEWSVTNQGDLDSFIKMNTSILAL